MSIHQYPSAGASILPINLTTDVTGVLPRANGGTNSSTALNNNRVMVSSGGKIDEASAITASRALISDANGIPTHATTTSTEIGYVGGVTSAIQTQIDGKQPLDSDLTAVAGLSSTGLIARTGAGTASVRTVTAGANITVSNGDGVAGNPTVAVTAVAVSRAIVSDGSGNLAVATTTAAEIGFVNGVTSAIQTQINAKQDTITGGATTITASNLAVSRALVSDGSGKVAVATTTAAEIDFVNGVTSAIQTQLDAKLCATSVAAVASNLTLTNKRIHFVDTSTARSLTLPAPTATSFIVIKDSIGTASTNNITVVRAASEKIETVAASYVLSSDLGSWTFVSNGTDWFII